ncbi:MAG: ROK family protein [Rhodocyclaceae bacterium]|nr:ROK family protein [Rhodocyclaceae bacterium]MDZ4215753.1 ROK family protein [Rhodocyclaceae bacterium]
MKVLAGDLGGTKALIGIAMIDPGQTPVFTHTRRLASADFSDCRALLASFCAEAGEALHGVTQACLAVAGPISADGRQARFTNLPWQADVAVLAACTGMPVKLVNDFAAVAAGVTVCAADQLVTLQAGTPLPDGLRLVIGAGTGLGVAAMLGEGTTLRILPSEGGHVGFSPLNATQARIHAELLAIHGRVTAERVISGPGLHAIHQVLTGQSLDPAEIAQRAMADDREALATTDAFFSAYAAFAGDMAMAFLPRGGLYLAGGVTQRLLPLLERSPFLATFNAKAEHAALVAQMPVHVLTDTAIGLSGAAVLAALS